MQGPSDHSEAALHTVPLHCPHTLPQASMLLRPRLCRDAGRPGRMPDHQAAGLAGLERPRLKASEASRLTVEQAAVQHATPAVRYHTAGGVVNPAQHTPALPGFKRQDVKQVLPVGTGSAASQAGSSALLTQFEAGAQAQSQPQSVARSTRGQVRTMPRCAGIRADCSTPS